MILTELQDWLTQEGFRRDLDRLAQLTVIPEIDNLTASLAPSFDQEPFDWDRLALAASVLARSTARRHQEAALLIATSAILLDTKPHIRDAGAILLEKLANGRAVSLAEKRGLVSSTLHERLGVALRIETQRRQLENSILVDSTGDHLSVNKFQKHFWDVAANSPAWLSASAPTASGKTFLVLKWLIERVRAGGAKVVVYLAPTRALVAEIEASLRTALLADTEHPIEVTSLPLADKYHSAIGGTSKVVFVLTQERLHLLANVLLDELHVDLLIVDEAHKIGDNQRGVVLQDAVERLIRIEPRMKVVFVSPATQNPEELLNDAPVDLISRSIDSDVPTVLQNIIFATQLSGKPTKWELKLRNGDNLLPLGTLSLANRPGNLAKRLAFIAAAAGARGGTLVYTNRPSEAEKVAFLISQLVEQDGAGDSDLLALADLARKGVHRGYALAPLVESGVAFHYGNMPSLIRMEIERLFKAGKIKFLVCTSTLIEGVNLSCRTIVVRGPRKGTGNPMEPHDFWNLAGRAGRWGDEFQGNIICIDPSNSDAWPQGVPQRARLLIKRETDEVMDRANELVTYLERRENVPPSEANKLAQLEQVGAYLASTHMRLGSITSASFARRHSSEDIDRLNSVLAKLLASVEIPVAIAVRNPGVSVMGMQKLLRHFRDYVGDPATLLPSPSESDDAYERFSAIMARVNRNFYPSFLPETLIPLHARITLEWLRGLSLPTIIRKRMEYHKKHGQTPNIAKVIRNTLELIEQTARFRAPKYFSAYVDVLHLYLREIKREDLIDSDLDIGVALEFGVSAVTLRSLMDMGVSRISAVALYERIAQDNLDRNGVLAWIQEHDAKLDSMEIPAIILREVREKVLGRAPNPTPIAE